MYFAKAAAVPRNHLRLSRERIGASEVWAASPFGWKGLATVPIMGVARSLSDVATELMQEALPQDARNPKEIAAWIQEDIDDFSETLLSRIRKADWSKLSKTAALSFIRGAFDQLVLVVIRAAISAGFGGFGAEETLATLMHRPLVRLRETLLGAWYVTAFPGTNEKDASAMLIPGDEFNFVPDDLMFSWLFRFVRSEGFSYFEHTFAKYLLMHSAPYLVGIVVESYHFLMGKQTFYDMIVRLGDGFMRRGGATVGASITMGAFAPLLPYSGRFRQIAIMAIEYMGQYLGNFYGSNFGKQIFGTPAPYGDVSKRRAKAAGRLQAVSSASSNAVDGDEDEEDGTFDFDDEPVATRGRPARNPNMRRSSNGSNNGRRTPPSRSGTPVANGSAPYPQARTPPPQEVASAPAPRRPVSPVAPQAASAPANNTSTNATPQSRLAARLARVRGEAPPSEPVAASAPAPTPVSLSTPAVVAAAQSAEPEPESEPASVAAATEAATTESSSSLFEDPLIASSDDEDDEDDEE